MTPLRTAAVLGALGVAFGAFGAHALREMVTADRLATWTTATHYHLLHAVVLLVLALAKPTAIWAFRLIVGGVVIFAGTLYALVLLDLPILGAITPIGGVLLIAGWLSLLGGK